MKIMLFRSKPPPLPPPRALDYLTAPALGMGEPPFKSLIRGLEDTPQIIWPTAIALGCLPELEGKTLVLKTPHTLDR